MTYSTTTMRLEAPLLTYCFYYVLLLLLLLLYYYNSSTLVVLANTVARIINAAIVQVL
jgi:hypothetical protein